MAAASPARSSGSAGFGLPLWLAAGSHLEPAQFCHLIMEQRLSGEFAMLKMGVPPVIIYVNKMFQSKLSILGCDMNKIKIFLAGFSVK